MVHPYFLIANDICRYGRKIEILRLHPLLAARSQAPSGRRAGYGWKCRLAIVSILEDILFVACGGAAAGAFALAVHLRAGLLTRFFPSSVRQCLPGASFRRGTSGSPRG